MMSKNNTIEQLNKLLEEKIFLLKRLNKLDFSIKEMEDAMVNYIKRHQDIVAKNKNYNEMQDYIDNIKY